MARFVFSGLRNANKIKFFLSLCLPLSRILCPHQFRLKCLLGPGWASLCVRYQEQPRACLFKIQETHKRKKNSAGAAAPLSLLFSLPPLLPPPPKHRLLIFKRTAIAWCGFKSWGAILPDDDSADVNGILIMPSATSETSPQRLLLFTEPGLSVKRGPDF